MPSSDTARILDGLDADQAAAVVAPQGPVRILAGAGTGKTRSVTRRIAYQHLTGAAPVHTVLAVTHSAKAAAEMRERLAALGIPRAQARTFHAAALRQLGYFWSATGLPGAKPQLVGDNRSLIRFALAAAEGRKPGDVPSESVLTATSELAWARAQLVTPDTYVARARAAGRLTELAPALLADAFRRYEADKRAREVLDFDDVIAVCARLLETDPAVADQVRSAYRSFVVDEYQDTDPAQQRLLDAWLGGRDTVAVVGDTAQAIYSFRGADPRLLLDFPRRYPHAATVSLVRDYRSTPQIVTAANNVVRTGAGASPLELVGQQPDGARPQAHACADEEAETRRIVDLVRDLVDTGTPAHEIAVLHRYNAQSAAIRGALTDAGLGLSVAAGDAFFTKPEVKTVMARFATDAGHEPDTDSLTLIAEALDAAGFDERTPPAGTGAARGRWENQRELLRMTRTLHGSGLVRAADLLSELAERASAEAPAASSRGVTVTTIHQAKGLEWDAVIVARMTVGSMPSSFASTAAEKAEERRLAYVAATRARHVLHLTWARTRDGRSTTPSPYLEDLCPGATADADSRSGRSARSRRLGAEPAPRPSGSRVPSSAYRVGCRVNHDRHGLGTVTRVDGTVADVDFGDGRSRTVRLDRDPVEPL